MLTRSATVVGVIGAAALAGALASAPWGTAEAAPGFNVRAVATGGEAAPEFLQGFTLAPDRSDVLGIDASGRALFLTSVHDASGQFHARTVYQETNQGLRAVLVTDEPAPSVGVGGSPGTIAGITGMKTDPGGDSLFACNLGADGGALVADVDSQQHVVAAEVSTVPGICGLSDVIVAGFRRGTAFQGGRALFQAETGPDPCVPAAEEGTFRRVGLGNVATLLQSFDDTIQVSHDPGVDKSIEGFGQPSIDQDGNAAFLVSYLDPAGEPAIVYAPASGAPQVIVAEDDPVFGRPGNVWENFPDVLIDAGSLTADSVPRIAYVGIEKASLATFVMEWNEGITSEVMRTFTSRRGVDFVGGFSTRLLSATRRRLIVLGEASGDSVGGFRDGAWRYDPLKSGDAQIELVAYSGEAAPGAPGYTFYWLRSVLCNSDGRIAIIATITNGSSLESAIFMEDGGQLKLAVREGDSVPDGRGGSVTLGEILATGDWGSGGAGRGVRFNDRGELVFSAVTDRAPNFGGVFVVSSGNTPPPGPPGAAEVRVRKALSGIVRMTGSKGDDRVSIRQTGDGEIELVAGDDTNINGGTEPVTLAGVTGLVVSLGDGDDEVYFGSNETVTTVVPRNVVFKMGRGDDSVTCENVNVRGSVTVDVSRGGACSVQFTQAEVERAVRILARSGSVSVDLDDTTVGGATTIKARTTGSCSFESSDCTFTGPLRYTGSPRGDDSVTFETVDCERPLTINVGRGATGDVTVRDWVSCDGVNVRSSSDQTYVVIEHDDDDYPGMRTVNLHGKNFEVTTGFTDILASGAGTKYFMGITGAAVLLFDSARVDTFKVRHRSGDATVDMENCTANLIDLRLGAGGAADCSFTDVETNRLKVTTGSGDDTCTLTDTQVSEDIVGKFGAGDDVLRLSRCGVTAMLMLFGVGDDCGDLSDSSLGFLRVKGGRGADKISGDPPTTVDRFQHDGVEETDGVVVLAKR